MRVLLPEKKLVNCAGMPLGARVMRRPRMSNERVASLSLIGVKGRVTSVVLVPMVELSHLRRARRQASAVPELVTGAPSTLMVKVSCSCSGAMRAAPGPSAVEALRNRTRPS